MRVREVLGRRQVEGGRLPRRGMPPAGRFMQDGANDQAPLPGALTSFAFMRHISALDEASSSIVAERHEERRWRTKMI